MYGSHSNRPLHTFRWLVYAVLICLFLVSPYLMAKVAGQETLPLWKGIWVCAAYFGFLVFHSLVALPETSVVTLPRIGLAVTEAVLAVMAMAVWGTAIPAVYLLALIAGALIGFEHGYRLGLASTFVCGTFFIWQRGLNVVSITFTLIYLALVCLPLVVKEAEAIRRSLVAPSEDDKLDQAYRVARRETAKRQENEVELYQERRRFEGLVDLAVGLAQFREQDELLQRIVEVACDQLNARGSAVLLLEQGRLRAKAETGMSTPMIAAIEKAVSIELLRAIFSSGQPIILDASRESITGVELSLMRGFSPLVATANNKPPVTIRVDQMIALPLASAHDSRPLGMILVVNQNLEREFTPVEANYLRVLSTNAAIALKNIVFTAELERSHWELIQALAQAIEAKDSYTSNHVGRVRDQSIKIARSIGLKREMIKVIAIAATLHDVGKISTPDSVLLKPGPLTDEEYEIMKRHAENGAMILRGISSLPEGVEDMVRHHHERWDGKGYPEGKKGDDIPLGAQIISIADCYDAMTYDRPYRKGFTAQEAFKRMEAGCGTQFNSKLLCAFFAIHGYVPQTEPSAVATYRLIVDKLRTSGIAKEIGGALISGQLTGETGADGEPVVKPLLLERS